VFRALDGGMTNPSDISDAERKEVTHMVDFCKNHHKVKNDFDVIVTSKSLNDHLGYKIPMDKVPLTKAGKPKATKAKAPAAAVSSWVQRERVREPRSLSFRLLELAVLPGTFRGRKSLGPTPEQSRAAYPVAPNLRHVELFPTWESSKKLRSPYSEKRGEL
jgi:hypothetical protein